jgi:hypothetical protein
MERLKDTIASGDSSAIEAVAYEIGTLVLESSCFPTECFEAMLGILNDKNFLALNGSWKLLRVFEENWTELSEGQRSELLPVLEGAYRSFADWMACFVISGILGELYRDEKAFATLCRLAQCSEDIPRSLVPHGFEHIVSDSSDSHLAKRALAELTRMQSDKSDVVRGEVKESLDDFEKTSTS